MMRFVELVMSWDDAPVNLKAIAEKAAKANSRVE
jgi:hypothetical protein